MGSNSKSYAHEYYLQNKTRWNIAYAKQQAERFTCECGKSVARRQLTAHENSKLHVKNLRLKNCKKSDTEENL